MAGSADGGGLSVVVPGETPNGEPILSVLLKRSFNVVRDAPCVRAETDRELVLADAFWDSPMNSSVRHESDVVAFKLGTDVVLNGRVHAPGGKPAQWCRAELRVGGRSKEIVAIGRRVARYSGEGTPTFTDPEPFVTMDLRYENAYGGTDVYSDPEAIFAYPNNPLGRGFVVANTRESVDNLSLPTLEDPANLLQPERLCIGAFDNWNEQPFPVGFGWYPCSWMGRTRYAGLTQRERAAEQRRRAEYSEFLHDDQRKMYLRQPLPALDFSYFQGASRGLAMPYLEGGEEVLAENLTREGRMHFYLPPDRPKVGLDIGGGVEQSVPVIHTVMIHAEEHSIDIVWRSAFPYPGLDWLADMPSLDVQID